jgi:hypothetical protein
LKGVKKYLTVVLLFSEINPRSVRHVNIDMEGYAVGIDSKGQLFCAVTNNEILATTAVYSDIEPSL